MATRIPPDIADVALLGRLVDYELQRISEEAKKGFVSDTQPVDKSRSYLFIDNGVLKFFNAVNNETEQIEMRTS